MKLGHILIFVIPLWRNPSSSYKGISPLPKMKFLDPELQIIFIPILVSFGRQDILHLVELNVKVEFIWISGFIGYVLEDIVCISYEPYNKYKVTFIFVGLKGSLFLRRVKKVF